MDRVLSDLLWYAAEDGLTYWDGVPFTGIAYSVFRDGSHRSEMEYRGGLRWGTLREWRRGGQLAHEAQFRQDVVHGLEREWHENGQLATERRCEYGITLSLTTYDDQGRLLQEHKLQDTDPDWQLLQHCRSLYDTTSDPFRTPSGEVDPLA